MNDTTTATVTISLLIENAYTDADEVITVALDKIIPAPPALPGTPGHNEDTWDEWAYAHIYQFTGTGHETGDAFYDVEVTACTDERLVGLTFAWGY